MSSTAVRRPTFATAAEAIARAEALAPGFRARVPEAEQLRRLPVGNGQLVGEHGEGRDRDDDQDDHRQRRPDDLEQRIVGEAARRRIRAAT